jgi:hypothetical protein
MTSVGMVLRIGSCDVLSSESTMVMLGVESAAITVVWVGLRVGISLLVSRFL